MKKTFKPARKQGFGRFKMVSGNLISLKTNLRPSLHGNGEPEMSECQGRNKKMTQNLAFSMKKKKATLFVLLTCA
jgi:hypothetical protein